jgi:hypothetical protein
VALGVSLYFEVLSELEPRVDHAANSKCCKMAPHSLTPNGTHNLSAHTMAHRDDCTAVSETISHVQSRHFYLKSKGSYIPQVCHFQNTTFVRQLVVWETKFRQRSF